MTDNPRGPVTVRNARLEDIPVPAGVAAHPSEAMLLDAAIEKREQRALHHTPPGGVA